MMRYGEYFVLLPMLKDDQHPYVPLPQAVWVLASGIVGIVNIR